MNVWLVTIGEPVPVDDGIKDRLHRTGSFAHRLAAQGHQVVWWTSTFNHFRKEHLFSEDMTLHINERLEIRLLHGCGYRRNVSPARFRDHYQIGRKFSQLIERETPPDVIVAALPTIELSRVSAAYGARHGIPVVVDIRDLWPDIFVDVIPAPMRWAGRLALSPLFRQAKSALRQCTSIIGVSDGYLQWGLRYAGRERRSADAVFPLGYTKPAINDIDSAQAEASLRGRGVDPSKFLCWFVGMFGRTYDLDTVIRAAKQLDGGGVRDVQFVLSGNGDNYCRLMDNARGLPNVVFTDWVSASQIAWLLPRVKAGLMAYAPGAPQGYPNKLFEYMSAGIPMLSSLQGETAALLHEEQCGLTYRPSDAGDLAASIRLLRDDDARRREMGCRCLALFERRFQADKIQVSMTAHLQSLVDASKRDSRRKAAA